MDKDSQQTCEDLAQQYRFEEIIGESTVLKACSEAVLWAGTRPARSY
jgi:hypothetical protein